MYAGDIKFFLTQSSAIEKTKVLGEPSVFSGFWAIFVIGGL